MMALEAYGRAVALDTLIGEARRRRALAEGVPKERVRFGGSSFLYSHLGDTYRHLGQFPQALEAFRHLSAITPTDAAAYEQIAQVQHVMGSTEDAIITLWQAQTLEPSEANEADLARSYARLDPAGCAVVNNRPNPSCPLVKAHRCRAQAELAARVAESGLPEEAAKLRAVAAACQG
jgi:tetratricopeptide (TPR) repeat protein